MPRKYDIHLPLLALLPLLAIFVSLQLCCGYVGEEDVDRETRSRRIAVIGGGVGGTFVSRYLVDYDNSCHIESLTLFDPTFRSHVDGAVNQEDVNKVSTLQGGRVSTKILNDGTAVELGASILYSGNKLVSDMVDADPDLIRTYPEPKAFGVWDGEDFTINSNRKTARSFSIRLAYRYNFDIFRMNQAVEKAIDSFDKIYGLLENPSSFYPLSADEIWDAVGLLSIARMNFEKYLDSIDLGKDDFFAKILSNFGFGVLRKELITSANLSNYNQKNSELNGLCGLFSFVPASKGVYRVEGGNYKIPLSAWKQSILKRKSRCIGKKEPSIEHISRQVTSVIFNRNGEIELRSLDELLGVFDIGKSGKTCVELYLIDDLINCIPALFPLAPSTVVILAAPLQQCQITFEEQLKTDDELVLHPLQFNGFLKGVNDEAIAPSSVKRKYKQTVTTVIANAELQESRFNSTFRWPPNTVYFTEGGAEKEMMTTIRHIKDGIYKLFSPDVLPMETLQRAFGSDVQVIETKVWGGPNGGAYPSFGGGGEACVAPPFLIHRSDQSALYYINGIEAAVASVEISAIGAMTVAKLVSKRLGLIHTEDVTPDASKEEL